MGDAGNNRILEIGRRTRKRKWIAAAVCMLAASVFSLEAQTQIDLASQGKRVDFSGASTTKPSKMGTALPGTCSTGESFFKLDAAPGANLYGCTGTNSWTQMSAGGGSLPSMGGQANKVLSNDGSAAHWRGLGGDLTGAPDAATVTRIQGRSVGPTAPADGQVLIWSNALGRWEPGMGGGGAAPGYTLARNSATELGLGGIAADTFRLGEAGCAAVGPSTFTVTNGTGMLWIALGSDCSVKVRHNVLGVCSANCTAVAGSTGFDPGDLPLYQWTATSAVLAANGTLKLTPYVSRPLVAGTNVSFGHTAGVTTINATAGGTSFDPVDLTATAWVRDEFFPSSESISDDRIVGQLGWKKENVPTTVYTATNLGIRHAGILKFTNTSGGVSVVTLLKDSVALFNPFANAGWTMIAVVKVPSFTDAAPSFGMHGAYATNPDDRVWIQGTATNWTCDMRAAGGSEHSVDTGVAVSTSQWVALRLRSTVSGTVTCSVALDDGSGGAMGAYSTEKTICAAGCDIAQTVPAVDMSPMFRIYHPSSTADMYIDKFVMTWTGL